MRPTPFNNEDLPFYLLGFFFSPSVIYFRNGNNWRDVQLWVNVFLYLPFFFSRFGHVLGVLHAWYFIYKFSAVTGDSHYLEIDDDDDVDVEQGLGQNYRGYNDIDGGHLLGTSAGTSANVGNIEEPAPPYSDAHGKQPASDNKVQQ